MLKELHIGDKIGLLRLGDGVDGPDPYVQPAFARIGDVIGIDLHPETGEAVIEML